MTFIGQTHVMEELRILAKEIYRGNHQNILILGSSGYGKTTLAKYLADYTCKSYQISIEGRGLDTNKELLIIDEAHKMKNPEILFPLMDKHSNSVVLLTTDLGVLPEPLVNRCYRLILQEYSQDDLLEIARYYSSKSRTKFTIPMLRVIVERSRNIPREIKNMVDRIILHQRSGEFYWDIEYLKVMLDTLGVYEGGFTYFDIEYLAYLKSIGGNASLTTICHGIKQSKETITNYIEPFLIKKGYIIITSKGRKLIKDFIR